ncbi:lipid droplet-associated hydrolase-like [Salvelinus sp. IW2-2015]|uniref:lipid droplet-associated hydrolase-like n=1 Tax=Salvelinus sp. IW2-2015 TaxID=2691554 RepID=UPI0038D359F1
MKHKLVFLREHVPRDTCLVLVGHSIGCYIILEMMMWDPELQSNLVLPSVEELSCSPTHPSKMSLSCTEASEHLNSCLIQSLLRSLPNTLW